MYANPIESPVAAGPILAGNCGYRIDGDRVVVQVEEIRNRRAPTNLSGTLGVELWGLNRPYGGGAFSGVPLAATQIGVLGGQNSLRDCQYDLIFHEPPAGTWHLTLMLREWEGKGFVTQDHVEFPVPYVVDARSEVVDPELDGVVGEPIAKPEAAAEAGPSQVRADRHEVAAKPESHPAVSLNGSSLKEIEGLKGVSHKLAAALVAARPFGSFEELLKVKGVGGKLLEKLRQLASL